MLRNSTLLDEWLNSKSGTQRSLGCQSPIHGFSQKALLLIGGIDGVRMDAALTQTLKIPLIDALYISSRPISQLRSSLIPFYSLSYECIPHP